MAKKLITLKKNSDFVRIKTKGITRISKSLILQKLFDQNLSNSAIVGYTATKKLGNAVKRNYAKRILRELAKNNILQYGGIGYYYVLIAKNNIFETSFQKLNNELKKLLLDNEKK